MSAQNPVLLPVLCLVLGAGCTKTGLNLTNWSKPPGSGAPLVVTVDDNTSYVGVFTKPVERRPEGYEFGDRLSLAGVEVERQLLGPSSPGKQGCDRWATVAPNKKGIAVLVVAGTRTRKAGKAGTTGRLTVDTITMGGTSIGVPGFFDCGFDDPIITYGSAVALSGKDLRSIRRGCSEDEVRWRVGKKDEDVSAALCGMVDALLREQLLRSVEKSVMKPKSCHKISTSTEGPGYLCSSTNDDLVEVLVGVGSWGPNDRRIHSLLKINGKNEQCIIDQTLGSWLAFDGACQRKVEDATGEEVRCQGAFAHTTPRRCAALLAQPGTTVEWSWRTGYEPGSPKEAAALTFNHEEAAKFFAVYRDPPGRKLRPPRLETAETVRTEEKIPDVADIDLRRVVVDESLIGKVTTCRLPKYVDRWPVFELAFPHDGDATHKILPMCDGVMTQVVFSKDQTDEVLGLKGGATAVVRILGASNTPIVRFLRKQ